MKPRDEHDPMWEFDLSGEQGLGEEPTWPAVSTCRECGAFCKPVSGLCFMCRSRRWWIGDEPESGIWGYILVALIVAAVMV